MFVFTVLSSLLFVGSVSAGNVYQEPPPTFDPKPNTVWDKLEHKGSKRGALNVKFTGTDGIADSVNMYRLDLVGDSHARGFAHGYLLAKGDFLENILYLS